MFFFKIYNLYIVIRIATLNTSYDKLSKMMHFILMFNQIITYIRLVYKYTSLTVLGRCENYGKQPEK